VPDKVPSDDTMDGERPNIHHNRYNDTRKPGQGFWRLMLVWQGSVFKLIWVHLVNDKFALP
jgi:hypothetical protein